MEREKRTERKGLWNVCFALAFAVVLMICCSVNAKAAVTKKPTNLHQVDATEGSITFAWDNGATDSGDPYTYIYEVSRSKDFSPSRLVCKESVNAGSEATAYENLSDGQDYYVRVGMIEGFVSSSSYKQSDLQWTNAVKMSTIPFQMSGSWQIKENGVTETSIKISWPAVKKANGYEIKYWEDGSLTTKTKCVKQTSVNLTKLKPDTLYKISVSPYRDSGSYKAAIVAQTTAIYTLSKVSDFAVTYAGYNSFTFGWERVFGATGYDIQVTSYKDSNFKHPLYKRSVDLTGSTFFASSSKFSGRFCLARIRAYKKMSNGKLAKSGWTKIYCGGTSKRVNARISGKALKIDWKKVDGATGYNIYVSNDYSNGYKKVATVNSKTTKCTLKKFNKKPLSKKKNYYVRVEPVRKEKKVTYRTFSYGIDSCDVTVWRK